VVLDLEEQPACDYFPSAEAPGPDATYPLQMWLCSTCKLAQLVTDPTAPDEPKAAEPAALRAQAAAAVDQVAAAKWLQPGLCVAEYGSPHGGSWLELLIARGLISAGPGEPADVVLDCFGLMHCADQAAAIAERASRVAPGGVLLLQYHSLSTIVDQGQWNALRHGHFAYYSATALSGLLAANGFALRSGWEFELYGGTVLLAATRVEDAGSHEQADRSVRAILQAEEILGITEPDVLARLQQIAVRGAASLHAWLTGQRTQRRRVFGYGAASRAVSLLYRAGIDRHLLPAIADASPAKQGTRMPGTDVPVIAPSKLLAAGPDDVLVLLPDLIPEVRAAWPGIEATGGRWVDVRDIL
jgi:hypothetical protein